jgi:nicotinamidase-related amidase
MTSTPNPINGLDALLTPEESVLILMDYQPFQFAAVNSHEQTMIVNNVVGLAKSAKIFGVPTIITAVISDRGGKTIQPLLDVFPDQEPIERTWINTWQDEKVTRVVKKLGRKKLIMAGLWTDVCVAHPAIQAAGEGYHVFAVTDACGSVSLEAHEMAVRRMVAAGVVPLTWMTITGEFQRDWAREESAAKLAEALTHHGGMTGIAFNWEQQLLNQPRAQDSSAESASARQAVDA